MYNYEAATFFQLIRFLGVSFDNGNIIFAIYVRGDTFMPPIYAAKLDQTWQALRNSRQIRTRKSNEGLDGVCGVGACSANQANANCYRSDQRRTN